MTMDSQKDFVIQSCRDHDIKFIRLWFTDILGFLKSFAITVEELEQAWLQSLRQARRPAPTMMARNPGAPAADSSRHVVVRLTAPPVPPLEEPGLTYRGQMPDEPPRPAGPARSGHSAGHATTPGAPPPHSPERWQPAPESPATAAPKVRLGQPHFPPAPVPASVSRPPGASPVGFPQ